MKPKTLPAGDSLRTESIRSKIGARIRDLRKEKGLSQGEVERRTGMLRCYICRIETGHNLPSLETIERFASALDVPLYRFFQDSAHEPESTVEPSLSSSLPDAGSDTEAYFLRKLSSAWIQLGDFERRFLISMARQLATRTKETPVVRRAGRNRSKPAEPITEQKAT
jgi:transcriptional regulator with XRE-family HTH domain